MDRIIHVIAEASFYDRGDAIAASVRAASRMGAYYETVVVSGRDGYWRALCDAWDADGKLIVIEQDMLPSKAHIAGLLACPLSACAVPYRLKSGAASVHDLVEYDVAPAWHPLMSFVPMRMVPSADPLFADGSGFGLVKLSPQLRRRIDIREYPVPDHHWSLIDSWFSTVMARRTADSWHVHGDPALGGPVEQA